MSRKPLGERRGTVFPAVYSLTLPVDFDQPYEMYDTEEPIRILLEPPPVMLQQDQDSDRAAYIDHLPAPPAPPKPVVVKPEPKPRPEPKPERPRQLALQLEPRAHEDSFLVFSLDYLVYKCSHGNIVRLYRVGTELRIGWDQWPTRLDVQEANRWARDIEASAFVNLSTWPASKALLL